MFFLNPQLLKFRHKPGVGICASLVAFITSRVVARQVVNVVLVQFAQFFSDTSNLLVHISSDIGDFTPNTLNLTSEFVADITDLFSNFGLDNINFSVYLVHTVFKPLGIDF